MSTSKPEMITELMEFFETFSLPLEQAGIGYEDVQKYILRKRQHREIQDIYRWVFTDIMKIAQQPYNYLTQTSEECQVQFKVNKTEEYRTYEKALSTLRAKWKERPWKV